MDREEALSRDTAVRRSDSLQTSDSSISAQGRGDLSCEETLKTLIHTLSDDPMLHLLVGAGPLYRGRRFSGPRITWFTEPGIAAYFGACDAAISAGGYNSFYELLYFQIPTLFYSQEKIADDQFRRIHEAETEGACVFLPNLDDRVNVKSTLDTILERERSKAMAANCLKVIGENGARRCARQLLSPFYSPEELAWASELITQGSFTPSERPATA